MNSEPNGFRQTAAWPSRFARGKLLLLPCLPVALALTGCEFDATGTGLNPAPGLAANNAYGCACQCAASQAVPAVIGAAADDAAEFDDGSIALGQDNLVLAQEAASPTLVGLRFGGLNVSADAVIEEAYVQFTSGTGNAPPGASFALPIAAGADDAAELPDTSVVSGGTSLAFQAGNLVGLRFTNVTLPPNAIVISAHVQFEAGASQAGVTPITIRGEKAANAATFAALAGDLSSRTKTGASVEWAPPEWTVGDSGPAQRTVDVAEIVEEISQEPGWAPGNALVLFFETAMGDRVARSFEGGAPASLELTLGVAPEPATIAISGEATDDSAPFSNAPFDLSGRTRTTATASWEPDPWMDNEQGLDQRTADLTDVIQAIVDEPGWSAGNALALFFEDSSAGGNRIARSFDGNSSFAAQLVVVALDPANAQVAVELSVCMPDSLDPNVEPNDVPTAEELAADCEGRVADNVQGLAAACGYTENCFCSTVELPNEQETAYDSSCAAGCAGEELDPECDNFDPANGVKTATHPPGGEPVCLIASSDPPGLPPDALAGGFFGQVSECEVEGVAEVLIDGLDDRFPDVAARIRIGGSPCPGASCSVTPSYLGAVAPISYEGGFLGSGDTTISEISVSGSSTTDAVVLDASGLGEIPAGETASSGRGRRQTNRIIKDDIDVRESFVGENVNAIEIGVDWDAASCFMEGPLFGGVIADSDPDEDEDATESDTTINLIADGILVNQPPNAAASASENVECTSPAGALVILDGAGSADPDDNIALARWNIGSRVGDAVGFGPTAGVPQALGMTSAYVHRVVDDFAQAGQDAVSVSVVDTTPPDLVEPEDLVVECLGPDGTPVHIGRAFARDRCDLNVEITNDAPAVFPVGDTVVTWTARDDTGNETTRMQTVTVVDTTPPVIAVELSPKTLWPPNHKMRGVEATIEVFDVCDPNPTVELVAIVSNEPDDGIADGATTGDIQGADLGTDDRAFEVRCERQGTGGGRVYTATYEASDSSGNTADDSDDVTVAKSQGGG
jgi:hypothetical protein